MNQESRNRCNGASHQLMICAVAIGLVFAAVDASAADVKIPQLQAAAAKGNVSQEIELAGAYFVGRGVPRDLKMAAYWYEKAAGTGDAEAQNEIGYFYQIGIGVPADPVRAFHWYQLAASSGLATAKVNLGVAYLWGNGVAEDKSLAVQLFHEAASKGSGCGRNLSRKFVLLRAWYKRDKVAAETWFETGVKLHDPVAAYNLGVLFLQCRRSPA